MRKFVINRGLHYANAGPVLHHRVIKVSLGVDLEICPMKFYKLSQDGIIIGLDRGAATSGYVSLNQILHRGASVYLRTMEWEDVV